MKWFRLYDEILEDPKMLTLSSKEFQTWILLLCLANRETSGKRGEIPGDFSVISRQIHGEFRVISRILKRFIDMGFLKMNGQSIQIVNWDKRQFKSDDVLQRVKRYRNVTVTAPDTDTDTDTDNTPLNTPHRKQKNRIEYGQDFSKFWDAYPEKTGKGKAYEEWGKIGPSQSLAGEIIESVNKHIEHSEKWQNGYIPNPATFLHQRRWEDQPSGKQKILSPAERGMARFLASEDE